MHIVLVFILHHLTLGQLRHIAPRDSVTMQVSHKRRRQQQRRHMIGSSGQALVHSVLLAEMTPCSVQLLFGYLQDIQRLTLVVLALTVTEVCPGH